MREIIILACVLLAACDLAPGADVLQEEVAVVQPPPTCATGGGRTSTTHKISVIGGLSSGVAEVDPVGGIWSAIDDGATLDIAIPLNVGERIDQISADVMEVSGEQLTMTLWKMPGLTVPSVSLGSATPASHSTEQSVIISQPHATGFTAEDVTSDRSMYWVNFTLSVPAIAGSLASVVGGVTVTTSVASSSGC